MRDPRVVSEKKIAASHSWASSPKVQSTKIRCEGFYRALNVSGRVVWIGVLGLSGVPYASDSKQHRPHCPLQSICRSRFK